MKKNIAIVWGGYSSEKVISAKSMAGIYSFIDKEKYNVYTVRIDKDSWRGEVGGKIYPIDKNDFSCIMDSKGTKTAFHFAYITVHGTPGEDGRLQGYFDMIGMPYSSCGIMASALTFNKYICNRFLCSFGIAVAEAYHLHAGDKYETNTIISLLQLPLFVKPCIGGSSFATSKVKEKEELKGAIDTAFSEANEVIIESFIDGREVTCGCYKIEGKEVVLPISEVITDNEFFDYEAKYEGKVDEITPANLPADITREIQALTSKIYDLVGAKGMIRVDYIIANGIPVLLEVNTTPGMTIQSFIPQQVAAAKLSMTEVITEIIENEYKKHKKELL